MKKSILPLILFFSMALTVMAQNPVASPDTTSLKGNLKAFEKEAAIHILNKASNTLYNSSNQNTTAQNTALLKELEALLQLLNERFTKEAPAQPADKPKKP